MASENFASMEKIDKELKRYHKKISQINLNNISLLGHTVLIHHEEEKKLEIEITNNIDIFLIRVDDSLSLSRDFEKELAYQKLNKIETVLYPLLRQQLDKIQAHSSQDLTELRKYVEKNAEYVGDNFASEVRSIHYDKKNVRNIYGKTSLEEHKELIEEGIEINSIPWVDKTDS